MHVQNLNHDCSGVGWGTEVKKISKYNIHKFYIYKYTIKNEC